MAYIDKAKELGREPLSIAELELDSCSLTFGVFPCLGIGEKCYNTISTCKSLAEYTASSKVYTFTDKDIYSPVGLKAFPAIDKVSYSPTKLEFGKGLGYRSKVSIRMQDFKHHDRNIDPYQADRIFDTERGTFFRKMIARNKYYNGRPIRVLSGFNSPMNERMLPLTPALDLFPSDSLLVGSYTFNDDTVNFFTQNDFETRSFIIEKIELNQDTIVVTGKDILKKLDKDRAQVPVQTSGVLKADITAVATSLTLTDDSFTEYPASGHIRINDEIMSYASKASTDTLSGLVRAQYGTTADEHSLDDGVQLCKVYTNVNVVDIIKDILINFGDIPASYLPYDDGATGTPDEWDIEKSTFLSYANYSTIISEPEGADKLLEELTEQSMLMLWWDDRNQKIKLKALTPPTQRTKVAVLNEQVNFIKDSIRYKISDGDRYSQLWMRFFPNDWSKMKDPTDFGAVYVGANLESEVADRYGDKRVKTINSRWFNNPAQAATLYTRFAQLYTDAPTEFKAKLDAKDSYLQIGDFVDIISSYVVDPSGTDTTLRTFITEIKETVQGHEIEITALSTGFTIGQRYGYVAPNTMVDYTSASDAEKELYGFIVADATGFPSDDGASYKII